MKRILKSLIAAAILLAPLGLFSDNLPNVDLSNLDKKIPLNSDVIYGKLDNGITYYIMKNQRPENRAQFQLVVTAGSVQEDEDQKGLAHFTEHMIFNGTKMFPGNTMLDYLQAKGIQFGADINAGTSYERTSYQLPVPTDDPGLVDTTIMILRDIASNVTFSQEEYEKERGVIMSEWRQRKDVQKRMMDAHMPVILKGSRHVDRDIIGDTTVIQTAPRDVIYRYYKDWYRPDLMAVIAVGDFEPKEIEKKIKNEFGAIKAVKNPREHKIYPIPPHEEARVSIYRDQEMPMVQVLVYFKSKYEKNETWNDYRNNLIENLFVTMINQRFAELSQKPESPFLQAAAFSTPFLGDAQAGILSVAVKQDRVEEALKAAMIELERAKRHGFTESEFERAKESMLSRYEQLYAERDKLPTRNFVSEFEQNFVNSTAAPGIAMEYAATKKFMADIKLNEVDKYADSFAHKENSVITVTMPEKESLATPEEEDLAGLFDAVNQMDIQPYVDKDSGKPLFDKEVVPGKVVSEKTMDEIGTTELTLSNGIKVVLKPTEFQNNEISFEARSPGGHSLASDDEFYSASYADNIVSSSGVGEFDLPALRKKLAGKIVSVSPYIGELTEGFSGSCATEDFETALQLVNLYFTEPRVDPDAFEAFLQAQEERLRNRAMSPRSVIGDTLRATLNDYHPRRMPMSVEKLEKINPDQALAFYKERFADASDFTFTFVGNFEIDKIKPLLTKYLGSLPALNRNEKWKDFGIRYPNKKIVKKFEKGIENKSSVYMIFPGEFIWSDKNELDVETAASLLREKLLKQLREEEGGVYSPGIFSRESKYPNPDYYVAVIFDCDPHRVDEFTGIVLREINNMRTELDKENANEIENMKLRKYEKNLKENDFWLGELSQAYYYGEDPTDVLALDEMIESISAKTIRDASKKYVDPNKYVLVIMNPEK